MPHSLFLGRPEPAPGEPLWLPSDRDKVRAVLADRAETCQRCHTRQEEWGSYDEAGVFVPFEDWPYEPALHECPGCRVLDGTSGDKERPSWVIRYLKRRGT